MRDFIGWTSRGRARPVARSLTDGQEDLEARIDLLEGVDALVEADLAVLGLVVGLERAELALLQPAEGEDDVRAQIGLHVLGQVFADLGPVLRPVGVVAHDLVVLARASRSNRNCFSFLFVADFSHSPTQADNVDAEKNLKQRKVIGNEECAATGTVDWTPTLVQSISQLASSNWKPVSCNRISISLM